MIAFLKRFIAGNGVSPAVARLDAAASWRYLVRLGVLIDCSCKDVVEVSALPEIVFRNTRLEDMIWDNLTLPRLVVNHCEVEELSAVNAALSGANWCWSALVNVDFSLADLSSTDFRAGYFVKVNFSGADLRHADLRHAVLENCDFSEANLTGALMTANVIDKSILTSLQMRSIKLCRQDGPEPPDGGK